MYNFGIHLPEGWQRRKSAVIAPYYSLLYIRPLPFYAPFSWKVKRDSCEIALFKETAPRGMRLSLLKGLSHGSIIDRECCRLIDPQVIHFLIHIKLQCTIIVMIRNLWVCRYAASECALLIAQPLFRKLLRFSKTQSLAYTVYNVTMCFNQGLSITYSQSVPLNALLFNLDNGMWCKKHLKLVT